MAYRGTAKVQFIKLQILIRQFEEFSMESGDTMEAYFSKILEVVN